MRRKITRLKNLVISTVNEILEKIDDQEVLDDDLEDEDVEIILTTVTELGRFKMSKDEYDFLVENAQAKGMSVDDYMVQVISEDLSRRGYGP